MVLEITHHRAQVPPLGRACRHVGHCTFYDPAGIDTAHDASDRASAYADRLPVLHRLFRDRAGTVCKHAESTRK